MSAKETIESNLKLIISMVEGNKSEREIAEELGISYSTWKRQKKENGSLQKAIAEGKDTKNQNVIQAMYNNCIGFEYSEEIATKIKEEVLADDGETVLVKERVVISKVKKKKLPDFNAQKYWAENRMTKYWKNDPSKNANDKELIKLKKKEVESKTIL